MPIPDSERVIYGKPALEEVVCQLRYPTILKIGSEDPAEFQDRIREHFPIFEETAQEVPGEIPPQLAELISQKLRANSTGKQYSFLTEDRAWTLSLNRDFLALSTTAYITWEGFKFNLNRAIDALHDVYAPSSYTRIGLRYRDVIIRSHLDLHDRPWSELLKPFVTGILSVDDVKDEVRATEKETLLGLGDRTGDVRVKHFLALVRDNNEECYVIDADFFADSKTERQDAISKLNDLNKYAGRLFRWFIEEPLYLAMDPKPVSKS